MTYIDRLIADCHIAKASKPTSVVKLDLASFDKTINLDQLAGLKNGVYIIEQVHSNIDETFQAFAAYKAKHLRKCPKLNNPSKIMYIGSSISDIKNRINQHLGNGAKGTYALQLKHWFTGTIKITVNLYDIERRVLQIIEDDLSDRLKPAFGKQGGNNH